MADFNCKRCGFAMHLGRCADQQPLFPPTASQFHVDKLPTGEVVVKRNGVTVAQGFDDRDEATAWIADQCQS